MSANQSTPSSTEDTTEADKMKQYLDSLKAKLQTVKPEETQQSKQPNQQNPSSARQFFEDRTKQYLSTHKPKLYILTPCYGGLCHVNYINKVMDTKDLLRSMGIEVVIQFIRKRI
jgi:hypothetical protein